MPCGDQATQRIGNKNHQVAEVRQIPAAYFPIESEADCIAKITRVLVLSAEPIEDQLTGGKASEGNVSGMPPAATGSSPNLPNLPQPRGVPSVMDGNSPLGTHCRQDSRLAS